jgi:hypothetical protein
MLSEVERKSLAANAAAFHIFGRRLYTAVNRKHHL